MIFINGTGSRRFCSERYSYNGTFSACEAALETAIETGRMAFAPRRPLFSVPSVSISILSVPAWSVPSIPRRALRISVLIASTAFLTPFPRKRSSSSRFSTASYVPVEAPEGHAARPKNPPASMTSASTVGLPLESMISLPVIFSILIMWLPRLCSYACKRAGFCNINPVRTGWHENPRICLFI
ncbi:MAG: hypothetical protein BWY05_01605 [Euryarchaeota archaeon ADurb.Bin165]|nr:MAG: hypothetical protein BWY05_01605 [Euryarchaeota archaeon ADurb.Bin165]